MTEKHEEAESKNRKLRREREMNVEVRLGDAVVISCPTDMAPGVPLHGRVTKAPCYLLCISETTRRESSVLPDTIN